MFLILKDTDWKEEDYVKHNIVPFGWMEDNNRLHNRYKTDKDTKLKIKEGLEEC